MDAPVAPSDNSPDRDETPGHDAEPANLAGSAVPNTSEIADAPSFPTKTSDDAAAIENVAEHGVEHVVVAGAHGGDALRVGDLSERQQPRRKVFGDFFAAFLPNRAVSAASMRLLIVIEAAIALALWWTSPFEVLPRPNEVLASLQDLWLHQGLGQELAISFGLNLRALAWASLISLGLAYLTVIPVFRPIVAAISKGRFLSMVGFTFVFTLIFGGGGPLKTSLLVYGVTVFYITSMASVIAAIPKTDFDYARTLRMNEWQVVWEVVILGTVDKALEVLRQNAAIGWMMLTLVEGIVRSEGGVGAMLLNQQKHFRLSDVFAIQLLILLVGMMQDYGIGVARRLICPHVDITLERK